MSTTILVGDCRMTLATLPADSVQCCVTSPPYFNLRDYGHDGQIGLEASPDAFVEQMVAVFREVRRVLRPDGVAWCNLGDSYGKDKQLLGIPWRVAFALQADGWWLRSAVVWAKPNPMPESVRDRPTSAYEMVFMLTRGTRYFYDAAAIAEPCAESTAERAAKGYAVGGTNAPDRNDAGVITRRFSANNRNARNVWTITPKPFRDAHFATMPPDLAERCIKAGTSERGACPHCGAPWGRVVERTSATASLESWAGQHASKGGTSRPGGFYDAASVTTGWAPSCACPAHDPVPCVVLDPFGGAGTTGLVASQLGCRAILCELNAKYAALAKARIGDNSGLLSPVVLDAAE